MVVTDGSFEGIPAGNDRSFRIEAIQMLHALCVKKRLPEPPEYKEENVLSPSYERKYVYSVNVVTSFGTVVSVRGDEKSRKTYAMNSAAYKMFLAVQVSYNMINTTIQSYRMIYTKEADRMINTKEADHMINTKESDRMINTKEADRMMINTEEADCMINTEEADCMIKTKESDSMLDYIDSLLYTLGAKALEFCCFCLSLLFWVKLVGFLLSNFYEG